MTTTQPYAHAYDLYWSAGWRGILPVPLGRKAPVPTGFTGSTGAFPSYADCMEWAEGRPDSNIVLRLPDTLLGVDVDAYDGKGGGDVLATLERELGDLPPTWRVTSRDDGRSGIRLYRIEPGLRWPGILGPGIETVRFEHRYAVTWPSVHPSGGIYRWIKPDGSIVDGDIPHPTALPRLPEAWVLKFTGYEKATTQERLDMDNDEAVAWLTARDGDGRACPRLLQVRAEALSTFGVSSRHEWAMAYTNRLAWLAGEGHYGALALMKEARQKFVGSVSHDRSGAGAEFDRLIAGAVRMAAAEHSQPINIRDACLGVLHGTGISEACDPPLTASSGKSPTKTSTTYETAPAARGSESERTDDSVPTATAAASFGSGGSEPSNSSRGLPTEADLDAIPDDLRPLVELECNKLLARRIAARMIDPGDQSAIVEDTVQRLIVAELAKREYQKRAEGSQTAPEPMGLAEILTLPDAASQARIDGLWPAGGRIVLAAVAKAGKSTLVANLVKSLADESLFLGRFPVRRPEGSIVVIDNELDPRQIRANYERQDIENVDKVKFIPLRGKVGTFDIMDPAIRTEWAERIKAMGATVVIFDCLRPLIDALGMNENTDAGRILVAFDALLNDAGVSEGMVVHHMGHSGDRARGDTRIRDWPDAEWKLLKEKDAKGESKDQAPRFFSAFGRDVNVPEGMVNFDPATCGLTVTHATRETAKVKPVREVVLGTLRRTGGDLTTNALTDAVIEHGHPRDSARGAIKSLLADGLIRSEPGPNRSTRYWAVDPSEVSVRSLLGAA